MLIYGVKISDIKKYNEQKAERFFEILQKTNASNIAEKYFLDKTKIDGTFGDFLSNFDDGYGNYGAAACLKEIIENIEGINISCDTVDGVQYLKRCGNAVCPPIPAALVKANLPELCKAERQPICRPDRIQTERNGQLKFA